MPLRRVLKRSELPPGSRKIIELDGFEILLLHSGYGIFALSNICPHNGGSLGEGDWSGRKITCPLHFWTFDILSGRSIKPPSYCLETYPVEIENEWIRLELPERDLEE